jgi:uncharacterized protein YdaU (DUF1376 family)
MTNEEFGIYWKLICNQWLEGGPLEKDNLNALVMGADIPPRVLKKFVDTGTHLVNERIERIRNEKTDFIKRQSENGKAGAEKRWAKNGDPNGTAIGETVANQSPLDSSSVFCLLSSSSSSVSGLQSSDLNTPSPSGSAISKKSPKPTYSSEFESWYSIYPRKESKAKASSAFGRAIKEIALNKSMTELEAQAWLEQVTRVYANSPAGNAGEFVPYPASWLNAGKFDDDQSKWQRSSSQVANSDPRGNFAVLETYMRTGGSDEPSF